MKRAKQIIIRFEKGELSRRRTFRALLNLQSSGVLTEEQLETICALHDLRDEKGGAK